MKKKHNEIYNNKFTIKIYVYKTTYLQSHIETKSKTLQFLSLEIRNDNKMKFQRGAGERELEKGHQ